MSTLTFGAQILKFTIITVRAPNFTWKRPYGRDGRFLTKITKLSQIFSENDFSGRKMVARPPPVPHMTTLS